MKVSSMRPKGRVFLTCALWLLGAAVLLWSLVGRLRYASGLAASWDAVDFALALDRFDLLAMQPHFPGYPYFILGGMALHRWVENPAEALSMLNAGALFTAVVPLYALCRRYASRLAAFLMAAVLMTLPYLWVLGTQPMSEGLGVAAALWYIWAVAAASDKLSVRSQLAAAGAFGLLSGIRVSFFPLGAGLVWLWCLDWRKRRSWKRLALYAAFAAVAQALWVAVLVLSEGNAAGFVQLARGFVDGHFNEWGGGINASPVGPGERVVRMLAVNGLWTALWGKSAVIGWLWGLMLGAGLLWARFGAGPIKAGGARGDAGLVVQDPATRGWTRLLLFLAVLYGIWAWVGQNIEKPRHIVPMVLLLTLLLLAWLVRRVPERAGTCALAVLAIAQLAAGTDIARLQQKETPAVYQLADYMQQRKESDSTPFVLYTWEETRVLYYLKKPFSHKRIYTYEYFLTETAALEGHQIYLTGKVLEGFKAQGRSVEGSVGRVAEFRSSGLFDPVYNQIELYEWKVAVQ